MRTTFELNKVTLLGSFVVVQQNQYLSNVVHDFL